MSAFVLNQENINLLTQATDAILRLNKKYPGSYHLAKDTVAILGQYTGDMHNIYRALYITNIKAVNGRYSENTKTLPKYQRLSPWNIDRGPDLNDLKKACCLFGCYLYQISEDPIDGTKIYNAFQDIKKSLCSLYFSESFDWSGNPQ